MAFRGYFALNGVEIANSSRVVAHVGADTPTRDIGLLTVNEDCSLTPVGPGRLLANVASSQSVIAPGRLLATPPDGSRLFGPGLALVEECWTPDNLCFNCRTMIGYDDSWEGLSAFLGDSIYRPELAPWYTTRVPESAEFGGIWVLDVKGLNSTPVQVEVTEMAGDGGVPGPHRDASRKVTFDAMLIACSNAGLTWGLQWLNCQLRDTIGRNDSVLRYLTAHPQDSSADPATLVREVHGVVLTQEAQVTDAINAGRGQHRQATSYRVSWELTVTRPHSYSPPMSANVLWDSVTVEPIKWAHAGDCKPAADCGDMPIMFGTECQPERIEVVTTPPPSCGGCLPVCAVETHVFEVPVFDYPLRCHQTAVTMVVTNNGTSGLTLQGYWRRCNSLEKCDDERWPIQITGLPPTAVLHLDGISKSYWVHYAGHNRRPFGIVGTPNGAPWRPPLIDRAKCWELVVVTDGAADFDVSLQLTDRET